MIGKVSGRLDHRGPDYALIETAGGVGYQLVCSERTLALMPKPGERVALYAEMVVREDLVQLIGFVTLAERELWRLLVTVQGVGAKAALAILGTLGADGVARALSLGDVSAIRAAPGIGPKLAQRVVLELQARAPQVMAMGAGGAQAAMVTGGTLVESDREPVVAAVAAVAVAAPSGAQERADALSALVNLGYGEGEAAAAVAVAEGTDAAALIRASLKALAPKG